MAYTSIVDYLKSKGLASDINSRAALAKQYGITNYSGTAEQNTSLLGKLQTPAVTPAPAASATKTMGEYGTVGNAFSSTKQNSTNYSAPAPKTPTAAAPANYTAPKPTEVQSQISGISSKIAELKNQLGAATEAGYTGANASKEIKYDSTGKIIKADDVYGYSTYKAARNEYQTGLDKITADLEAAKIKQKEIYDSLATKQTQLYNAAYAELGLDDKKNKISEMDNTITAKTAERDKSVLDENGKPIAQWLITGDLKQTYNRYNAEITQLTNERNAAASEYNTNLDELGARVEAGMADAKTAASYWDTMVANLSNQSMDYQKQLLAILGDEEAAAKSDRDYELERALAGQTIGSSTGGYFEYNPLTGETKQLLAGTGEKEGTIKTQITEVNGKKVLINSETGDTIKELGAADKVADTESTVDSLKSTKTTIDGLLTDPSLKKVVNKGALSNMPYAWENMDSKEKNFIATVEQLISQSTLDTLIAAKAKGATFGALSDKETAMLKSAASKIGTWSMENKNGKVLGYSIDEASFKKELETLRDLASKAINAASGSTSSSNNSSNGVSSAYKTSTGGAYSLPW
jgi:hypothetical protein